MADPPPECRKQWACGLGSSFWFINMDIALIFHLVLGGVGIIALVKAYSAHLFDPTLFMPLLPATGGLAASYLWIRPDLWYTTKDTTKDPKSALSRQADCIVTFIFISAITWVAYKFQDTDAKRYMFVVSVCLIVAIGNAVSRALKACLEKWHKV